MRSKKATGTPGLSVLCRRSTSVAMPGLGMQELLAGGHVLGSVRCVAYCCKAGSEGTGTAVGWYGSRVSAAH